MSSYSYVLRSGLLADDQGGGGCGWTVSYGVAPQHEPLICPWPVRGRCRTGQRWGRASRADAATGATRTGSGRSCRNQYRRRGLGATTHLQREAGRPPRRTWRCGARRSLGGVLCRYEVGFRCSGRPGRFPRRLPAGPRLRGFPAAGYRQREFGVQHQGGLAVRRPEVATSLGAGGRRQPLVSGSPQPPFTLTGIARQHPPACGRDGSGVHRVPGSTAASSVSEFSRRSACFASTRTE